MKLHCDHLVKRYRKRTVVNEVSNKRETGRDRGTARSEWLPERPLHSICLLELIRPGSGHIYLDEEQLTRKPMYKRARLGIGYLAQEASVFRNLTVRENLESVLQFFSIPGKEIRERADRLIEEFNLQKVVSNKGYSLSGGERRRTEIARAMITNPKFILLDEPFAGVDPIAVEDIQSIVKMLQQRNIGIRFTDHNVHETLAITDRAYLMFEGKILKEGTGEELEAGRGGTKAVSGLTVPAGSVAQPERQHGWIVTTAAA